MPFMRRVAHFVLRLSLGLLIGGFLSVLLVRHSPGFGVDERELDPSLSEGARARIRANSIEPGMWKSYTHYVIGALQGDFGVSSSLNLPVRQLLVDRVPVTAKIVAEGLVWAWMLAFPMAAASVVWRSSTIPLIAPSIALLCIPSGLMAICFFLAGLPVSGVIAAGIGPKVFI